MPKSLSLAKSIGAERIRNEIIALFSFHKQWLFDMLRDLQHLFRALLIILEMAMLPPVHTNAHDIDPAPTNCEKYDGILINVD